MKTYEEFREDLMENLDNDRNEGVFIGITHAKIEELAAKSFAKQWAYEAIIQIAEKYKLTLEMSDTIKFMDRIDAHH